jgi:hypothetical protein
VLGLFFPLPPFSPLSMGAICEFLIRAGSKRGTNGTSRLSVRVIHRLFDRASGKPFVSPGHRVFAAHAPGPPSFRVSPWLVVLPVSIRW